MPAKLQWVRVGEEVVHVGQYAHLKPRDRPKASCPICGEQVVMKLGAKVAHHCAHKPDATCAATSGETAVHLNCKLYIARKLEKELARAQQDGDEPRLMVRQVCGYKAGWYEKTCTETRSIEWVKGWDQVAVELRVGNRQPDVTLLRNGQAIAGIEVHVTNAVSAEKAADLNELGLPWIEVKGTPRLYEGNWPWNGLRCLDVGRTDEGRWHCDACAVKVAEAERQAKEQAEEAALREEARARDAAVRERLRNNGWHNKATRIVDYYYYSGKKYRDVYRVDQFLDDGQVTEMILYRVDKDENLLEILGAASDTAKRQIAAAFREEIDKIQLWAAVVDTEHKWRPAGCYTTCDDSSIYGDHYNPYRYTWDERRRVWRKRWRYRA